MYIYTHKYFHIFIGSDTSLLESSVHSEDFTDLDLNRPMQRLALRGGQAAISSPHNSTSCIPCRSSAQRGRMRSSDPSSPPQIPGKISVTLSRHRSSPYARNRVSSPSVPPRTCERRLSFGQRNIPLLSNCLGVDRSVESAVNPTREVDQFYSLPKNFD